MSGPRFTDYSAVTRFTLSDDDWVDFRSELSFSEVQQIESGALLSKVDQKTRELAIDVDWSEYEVVRLAAWIADWSFVDGDGLKEPATRQSIRRLNQATAKELSEALDAHVASLDGDLPKDGNDEAS